MMKTLKNILKVVALAGAMIFMPYCQKDDIKDVLYETPHFRNISERKIAGNLERPSGLSYGYNSTKSGDHKSAKYVDWSVFAQGPLFYIENNKINFAKSKNPTISQMSGSLNNLTVSSFKEFDIEEYFIDFNTGGRYGLSDTTQRPIGLTLDNLVMKDGSVLFSSNCSNKIFKISPSSLETYVQDNKLDRITDMILGTDGKVYVVQAPLINYNDSSIVESSKRVISIDNKLINVELNLPSDVNTHSWAAGNDYYTQKWWVDAPFVEKLKIVENSKLGKERFGSEFYISDLLEDVIYKVDAQKNVSVLAKGLRYPSSLAVDSSGNIFYTTSPLWLERGSSDIEYPTELRVLNPETGESATILKFDEKDIQEYSATGGAIYVNYGAEKYVMPVGFDVSNVLYESADELDFLFTNSHQGTLKLVSVGK